MTFEEKIKALEETINKLSLGKVPLDEAIDTYSNAVKTLKECKEELDSFKLKIETLGENNGNN